METHPEKRRPPIRLLVAEDHKLVRRGLLARLEREPDLVVVGEASNGREAVVLAEKCKPDVVVIDVEMPRLNGIEATRAILVQHPGVAVVGLSMHADKGYAERMLAAGAAAHENKTTGATRLIETIRRVAGRR